LRQLSTKINTGAMAEQKEWGELQQGAAQIGERGGKSSEGDEGPGSGRGRRQRPRAEAKTRDDNDMGSPPPKAKAGGWGEDSAPAETGSDQPGSRRRFSLSRNRSKGDSRSSEGVSEATPDGFSSSQRKFSDDSVGDEDDDAAADEDDDDVIMIIPDLDDEQEEDMAFVVAEAPKNVRQVQSLQELNKNIQGLELPTDPAQERVDVSLLSSVLAPRELVSARPLHTTSNNSVQVVLVDA
jgi:hypothetical protein